MKPLLLAILALPWVVKVSTQSVDCKYRNVIGNDYTVEQYDCKEEKRYSITLGKGLTWGCTEESKDFCYDLAEALNEAHKRRALKLGSEGGEDE